MIRHTLLCIALAGLAACTGSDGAAGAAGQNGAAGASSLVTITDEPAGANCAEGGRRVDVGLDDDGDGVLDAEEIDDTTYVCDGGAGPRTLVTTTAEPAGANCANGGQRIDIGADDDGDNVLDPEEVETTSYVCNGVDAVAHLVDVTTEAPGANCAAGGYRIDRGYDDDRNSVLDPAEVDASNYLCHGQAGTQTLVAISSEPAGANCATGGQQIDFGSDDDSDNFLDAAEVDGTAYVCNGAQGPAGRTSLVRVTAEPAGANCATGGRRIDNGFDANANNVLDVAEIAGTSYVCNGNHGSIVDVSDEPAGANCEEGGSQIDYGIDDNGNGVLEPGEIDGTDYVCHGVGISGSQIFTASGTFTPPAGITSFRVLVVGGGGGGPGSHYNGGGSGHVRVGTFTVSSAVTVTIGAGGIGGQPGNSFPGTDGGASSFGAFLSATGGRGGWDVNRDATAGDGGSGGGGSGNAGCGGNGGTAGANGANGCTYRGSVGGNFDSLASLVVLDLTAGAGGAAGMSSHGGGGGGGGVLIDGAGGPGANGAASYSAKGGAGYGGGGGAGGYNQGNGYAVGGNGASGVVYVEW